VLYGALSIVRRGNIGKFYSVLTRGLDT